MLVAVMLNYTSIYLPIISTVQDFAMKSLNFLHDLVTFFFDHATGNFNL